ncbi:MAG: arylamine N-acetyltransferase [Hyphomicrobiales bacterium]|nr:MAG: arylamine N-acetyltransferase [Hyphomicrobiales bacterium]
MTNSFDLDRYIARIGHQGPAHADLATLSALHRAHVAAIPFEGLDPLLGRPVNLDLPALQAKLVDSRRGGYCFEQNTLFKAALDAIGFKTTGLSGRVRWMTPPEAPLGPRVHMLLKVDLPDGPYIADVGFGVCILDQPLRLEMGREQRTGMGTYRLTEANGRIALEALQPGGWRTAYIFDLEPQLASDYALGNWYTSTSPYVPFTSTLVAERVAGDKRYKLANTRLRIEARDGEVTSERTLETPAELHRTLDDIFGLTAPASAEDLFTRISR